MQLLNIGGFSMSTYYMLGAGAAPWGDYGNILWNGVAETRQARGKSNVLVSRTGPFVPPISYPFGSILVTDEFRQKILTEQFSGLSFDAWSTLRSSGSRGRNGTQPPKSRPFILLQGSLKIIFSPASMTSGC